MKELEVEIGNFISVYRPPEVGVDVAKQVLNLANVALRDVDIRLRATVEGEPVPDSIEEEQDELLNDEVQIARALEEAAENETPISDAAARVIAAQIHGGQYAATYQFVSTGSIHEELGRELKQLHDDDKTTAEVRAWIDALQDYLAHRENPRRVRGWQKLWLYYGPKGGES